MPSDRSVCDLLNRLLQYNPAERLDAGDACLHTFFSEMRRPDGIMGPPKSRQEEVAMPSIRNDYFGFG